MPDEKTKEQIQEKITDLHQLNRQSNEAVIAILEEALKVVKYANLEDMRNIVVALSEALLSKQETVSILATAHIKLLKEHHKL
jgi:DNA-binding MarR family transcriptional regulator